MPDSAKEEPAGKTKEEARPSAGPTRSLRRPLLAASFLALLLVGYNGVSLALVAHWDRTAERDPGTDILIGAEPRSLGPPDAPVGILFVHGFIGAGSNFWEVPERLSQAGFRVEVMRLPGHGTTPGDFARRPAEELLQAVLEELRDLKKDHEKVVVVGHSMGGALSTLAASMEEVDGLVLGAPYFGVTYRWYYVLPAETWTGLTSPFIRWVYRADAFIRIKRTEVRDRILSYRWIPARGAATLVELGRRAKDPSVLAAIRCPVLMLHSRQDRAASPAAATAAFDALGSSDKRVVWLENSDHHIFWDYDREEVAEEILRFAGAVAGG